ncbi:MAG: NAD(P)H-dependent oxidoreductase subunit E [Bacteriovoracaceae bacterium]|nr:NAD(P)H-dependent oxidoreductase subunit E [Bacteriovoracaceae bacterium]
MTTVTEDWGELYKKLDSFMASLSITARDPRRKGHLIKVLHRAQHYFGYLPEEVQKYVAEKLFLQHSEVSGVISFYNYFTTEPKGKYDISVCTGTACYVKGSDKVLSEFEKLLGLKDGEVAEDGVFSLNSLRCVGACGLAPVVIVNEKVHGRIDNKDVLGVIAVYKNKEGAENE